MNWRIYLSGEIHTNWRDELKLAANEAGLNVEFLGPETDHDLSDNSGANILGSEDKKFWHDHKGAKINSIRIRRNIESSDLVVVKFEKNTNNGMQLLTQDTLLQKVNR